MIVKIQRKLRNDGEVLVYSRSGSVFWIGVPDAMVRQWMGRRKKVFAHATVNGSEIVINREAVWQPW